jgi:hypothetical protein
MSELIDSVPFGKSNALGWKEIADKHGVWAPLTIRTKLDALFKAGAIKRTEHQYRADRTRHVYYRECDA